MGRRRPAWKNFELVIAEIQKQLAPAAEVCHNHKVMGQSGRPRQLDVTIAQKIGGIYPILIVLECRRKRRVVSIEAVESFSRKLKDVRASLGVMVSTSGFAQGAQAIALQDNIMLMKYREAQRADWDRLLGEKAWISFVLPRFKSESIEAIVEGERAIPLSATALIMDRAHAGARTVWSFFEEIVWPSLSKERELGPREVPIQAGEELDVQYGTEVLPLRRLRIRGVLSVVRYLINLRLASGDVLESGESGPIYTRVTSEGVDWAAAIARTPGVPLSQEEYDQLQTSPGGQLIPLDLTKVKKYIRLDIEARKND